MRVELGKKIAVMASRLQERRIMSHQEQVAVEKAKEDGIPESELETESDYCVSFRNFQKVQIVKVVYCLYDIFCLFGDRISLAVTAKRLWARSEA